MIEWLKNLFGGPKPAELRTPANAGEGVAMPDGTTNTATPPAASGGITLDQFNAALNTAIGAATKPLLDKIAALETGLASVKDAAGKAGTPEAVAKLVADQLTAQNAKQTAAADLAAKRTAFIADTLKGVPAIYAGKLGDDPAMWADEAKTIRETFQADLTAAGIKAPAVSSNPPAGAATGTAANAMVDTSKLSGIQLIALGVKQNSTPVTIAPNAPAPTATPAPAAPAK